MSPRTARVPLQGSCKELHIDFLSLPTLRQTEEFSVTIRLKRTGELSRQVAAFAEYHNLKVLRAHARRREVVVRGAAADMQRAFGVELRRAKFNGRECRVRRGEIKIPRGVAKEISSVTGLDNRPFAKPHYRVAHTAAGPGTSRAFTPLEIGQLYNFPTGLDGTGQTIALLELDGGFRPAEMAEYFKQIGVAPPSIEVVTFEGGGQNNPGSNALDPFCRDAEVALDIQVAGALAPGAKLLIYFAQDDSDESFLAAMSAIVHDEVHKPDIVSISWGGPETTATAQFRDEFDRLLETAARLGITVCVATGDNAAPDFTQDDPRWDKGAHVDFPASSPWALACGGTQITLAANAIAQEEPWFESPHDGAGGGISRVFPLPDYQQRANVPRALNPDGPIMRGVPDVAANASPGSGFRILCNGQWFPDPANDVPAMGGTSAVAPLWAALIARINQALGSRTGFLNPVLYDLAGSTVFRKPASGTNGSYLAGAGWDACTGLGIVDGAALLEVLHKRLAAKPVNSVLVPGDAAGTGH